MKKLNELDVLIIGLGQIGGSLAMDLTGRRLVRNVIGFDADPDVTARAKEMGIIDEAAVSLEDAVSAADLVIPAAPIREIIRITPTVCRMIRDDAAVMDVAGTKSDIVALVARQERPVTYIGGHPMAGDEGAGLDAAAAGKFAGCTFVLTPIANADNGWMETIARLVESVGAAPVVMPPDEHDRIIAATSHLPYALAVALMRLAARRTETDQALPGLIGGSFRSAARVAASSPDLTRDMFLTNRRNVVSAIEELIMELNVLKDAIGRGREPFLSNMIAESRQLRQQL
jgi:prephenate dehydrogenase